jgi:hypothetical protein
MSGINMEKETPRRFSRFRSENFTHAGLNFATANSTLRQQQLDSLHEYQQQLLSSHIQSTAVCSRAEVRIATQKKAEPTHAMRQCRC